MVLEQEVESALGATRSQRVAERLPTWSEKPAADAADGHGSSRALQPGSYLSKSVKDSGHYHRCFGETPRVVFATQFGNPRTSSKVGSSIFSNCCQTITLSRGHPCHRKIIIRAKTLIARTSDQPSTALHDLKASFVSLSCGPMPVGKGGSL